MKVRNWMTPNPITVSPDTPILDAQKLMNDNKIRRLPVVDKKGRILGIVTLRNILEAKPSEATTLSVHEMQYLVSKLTVSHVMRKDVFTVSPDDLVMDVIKIGQERGIGAFPVVEGGKLVGIATESEIFRAMLSIFGTGKTSSIIVLEGVELVQSLGAISKIAGTAEKRGVPVVAIFSLPHRNQPGSRVYLRVRTTNPGGIKSDLVNAGYRLSE